MPWLSGWAKRRQVTIDQTNVSGELNFRAYVKVSAASGIGGVDISDVFDDLGNNFKKIAVTTSDGVTQCYVEVVSWSSVTEYAELWVKIPTPSEGFIYLYYDNTKADNDTYVGITGSTPAMRVWANDDVTLANGTGVASGAPITILGAVVTIVTVTTEGTFTITLPAVTDGGSVVSGTATVTGSPVTLVAGANTITVSGTGTIKVTILGFVVVHHMNDVTTTTLADSTANANNGSKFLPGDAPIDNCDSTTNWTGTSLSNDTDDKKEGTGSLVDTIATPVAATNYDTIYTPPSPLNLGARQIDFWFKCDRASTAFTATQLRITDGAFTQTTSIGAYAANTWTRVWITLSASLNRAAITGITFRTTAADTTAFTKKIDIVFANGGPIEVDGVIGKAQDFDGSNDYVDCGIGASIIDIQDQLTIEAWFDCDAYGNNATIVGRERTSLYLLSLDPYGTYDQVQFFLSWTDATWQRNIDPTPIVLDTPYYYAGVWTGTHSILYRNGGFVQSYDCTGKTLLTHATRRLLIATDAFGYADWDGLIDEVRLSNMAGSATLIASTNQTLTDALLTFGGVEVVVAPTVTTQAVSNINITTSTGNGNIVDNGGEDCSGRGVCWNTTGNPTIADNISEETNSFGTGAFTRSMTGLRPGQHYYVKAYAYNSAGYGYGGQVEFTTPGGPFPTHYTD